ncbi:MAG: HEAT repeat domain-containing protein [Thermoanaerobaculia bacterium]
MNRIAEMFNIRPGEGRSTSLMILHAFFMGLSATFFETAASALFLTSFDAAKIPWVYITAAIVATVTGLGYSRLRDRVSFWALMGTTLVFLFVTVLGFRIGLEFSSVAWLVFGLFVWYRMLSILTDLEYWAVAARIYDVRQSKRLFGFIGSGEVIARTLGSFSIPFLVVWIAVPDLIVISAVSLLICLVLVIAVSRDVPRDDAEVSKEKHSADAEVGGSARQIRRLLANPYISLVFGLTALGILGKYFVDFAFLQQMQSRYHDVANLAGFFGIFSGVTQTLNLALRIFVSGRVLSRWGVRVGLLILPVAQTLCTLAIVIAGFRGDAALAAIFWLVIANQGIYKTVKHPFDNPSLKVLYQPLSRKERLTVQIVNEIVLSPITIGVAGAIMLLFSIVFPFNPVTFSYVMLATFVAWIVASVWTYRAYSLALVRALKARIVDSVTFTLDDEPSIETVRSKLESSNPADVIFCLTLLEKIEHKSVGESVIRMIGHPTEDVRNYAVIAAGRLKISAALSAIEKRAADQDESLTVRGGAIQSLALIGDQVRVTQVAEYLNHSNADLRRQAMIGLLRRGDPRYVAMVRQRVSTAAQSLNAEDRIFAAGVIGEAGVTEFPLVLLSLLRDEDIEVRKAALRASAGATDTDVLEIAVEAFTEPRLCSTASIVLSGAGEQVVPLLEAALERHPERATRLRIVRSLGRIGGERARETLRRQIDCPDQILRTQVLQSLSVCGYAATGEDGALIEERMRAEVAEAASKFANLADLSEAEPMRLLRAALEDEIGLCRRRLFLLMSFITEQKVMLSARDNYFSEIRDRRAYAIEVLDLKLTDRLRPVILPLLEELPLATRLERLGRFFPLTRRSETDQLRHILAAGSDSVSPWTQAAALFAVGGTPLPELSDAVRKIADNEGADDLCRETANLVLEDIAQRRKTRENLLVRSEATMHSTIERVIILKAVPMFAGATEQILAEIASVVEEVQFAGDERVFRKGDLGSSMYVIVSGRVRVHDGDRVIVHLGDRDVFGEMAILDPEPRSADVTAVEPTAVFRIDRDSFYELMADHIEIVSGVVHVICQRLRAATSGNRTDDRPPTRVAAPLAPAPSPAT